MADRTVSAPVKGDDSAAHDGADLAVVMDLYVRGIDTRDFADTVDQGLVTLRSVLGLPPSVDEWLRVSDEISMLGGAVRGAVPDATYSRLSAEMDLRRTAFVDGEIKDGRQCCVIPLIAPEPAWRQWGLFGLAVPAGETLLPAQVTTLTMVGLMLGTQAHRIATYDEMKRNLRIAAGAAKTELSLTSPLSRDDALARAAGSLADSGCFAGIAAVACEIDANHTVFTFGALSDSVMHTASRDIRRVDEPVVEDRRLLIPVHRAGRLQGMLLFALLSPPSELEIEILRGVATCIAGSIDRWHAERDVDLARLDTTRRLVEVQERERSVIAADIHDGVLQNLSLSAMNIESGIDRIESGDQRGGFAMALGEVANLRHGVDELRAVVVDLRPQAFDERGLKSALVELARLVPSTIVSLDYAVESELPHEISTTVFRITQEALTNIKKHARAQHAWITIGEEDGAIVLELRDDGVGLRAPPAGTRRPGVQIGMLGMRERTLMLGGGFSVVGTPGEGTTVRVTLPLPK